MGMSAAQKIVDKKSLQLLVPFNALSPMHFNEVVQKTVVEEIRSGRLVFKDGDRDNQSVYLLEGEISLLAGNDIVGAVTAGSDASRHPIAQQQPRQVSARAKTNVVVARVDSSLLDIMLTWDQSSGYVVSEISDDDDDDWMTRILQSQAFLKLPPSNIQRLLMRVESVPVQAGETIIQQGGEGDYFYIIKNGRCMVTRRPSANAKEVKLAELADGDAFGEDALVSDAKRNATITMVTDGVLMRLAKKDFVELLKEPLLNKLDYAGAASLVAQGAEWVDVRLPGEYENIHIHGSRNIPLSALRLEANGLNGMTKYIVCCDTGRRSASAAFVLSQRGFEVYVLDDGFSSVPSEALVGTAAATVASAVMESESGAAVVAIKPQMVQAAAAEPADTAAASSEALVALHSDLESLQREKQALESTQTQLAARVTGLQEELERVREASREQVLELEHTLAESRQESSAVRNELKGLKDTLNSQRQADSDVHSQVEVLESELAERRAREACLETELNSVRLRAGELDAASAADAQWRTDAQAEQAQLKARLEVLQPQAEQAALHLARIEELEIALLGASEEGTQSQTEQTQRVQALESALQSANAALEQQCEEAEQQRSALQAEHAQALESSEALRQQILALQTQLVALEEARTEATARLAAQEQQLAEDSERSRVERQAEQQNHAELQARTERLDQELASATAATADAQTQRDAAQQRIDELTVAVEAARVEQLQATTAAVAESERLRRELDTTLAAQTLLAAERDALYNVQAAAIQEQQVQATELEQAQARVRDLEQDAGAQVTQLEERLDSLRQQIQNIEAERASLQHDHAQLQQERDDLRASLDQAQEWVQALGADSGEQIQRLEVALEAAQRDLQQQQADQISLTATQDAVATELTAAQALLDETQAALALAQTATITLQSERDQAQQLAADLEARLNTAEQTGAQAESSLHATIASLHAELASTKEAQTVQQAQAEQLHSELELGLTDARAESEQQLRDAATALVAAEARGETLQNELAAATTQLVRLHQQQADAASSQDEQTQQLTQVRDQFLAAENQLHEVNAARGEIEARLAEMTQLSSAAQDELERLRQAQQQAIAEAQTSVRSDLEKQLAEVRSELDSARTALARGMEQRGNLEQGLQAELVAAKAEHTAALQQAEIALRDRQEQLAAVEASHRALNDQHASLLAASEQQQQAWQAELEQLRMATTADIEATHDQMQRLKEDLATARRLTAGDAVADELQRLQLLLDQAREEAAAARVEAEQARESAIMSMDADEVATLKGQLTEIQQQVQAAVQLRESAEQAVATLRQELQARDVQLPVMTESLPPRLVLAPGDVAPRRSGLWLGITAGVLFGALGVGAAFWFGKPVGVTPFSVQRAPTSQMAETAPARISAPVEAVPPVSKKNIPVEAETPAEASIAAAPQAAVVSKGREFRDSLGAGGRGPLMIEVAAARFAMGSGASSPDFNERPKHDVELPRFAIGKYEVTFDEFDVFARMTGRALPDDEVRGRGRRPVVNVSWEDATAYVRWLSEQTGKRYRLPAEAEWEYAAGNLGRSLYWWGNTPGEERANCYNCGSEWDAKNTAPVGSFAANQLGLFDTSGNVMEWVQDCYHANYESAPTDGSPWVSVGCTHRVIRGGGYNSPASTLRLTKRDQQINNMRMDDLGFRVARDL
jgi:formylglycine-generating enzyme required for sulfatase activity/CRP-like cAMP-binding protein/rhodanese-related sulfurtransferase/chromosome segregation ATPase